MLINCKNCGKPISDKAKVCPHCGIGVEQKPFSKKRVALDYNTLSPSTRESLMQTFVKENRVDGNKILSKEVYEQKHYKKVVRIVAIIALILCGLMAIFMMCDIVSVGAVCGIAMFLVILGLVIYMVCANISYWKVDYSYLKAKKRFELWLNKRGIDYKITYWKRPEWRTAYENIKIEEENN